MGRPPPNVANVNSNFLIIFYLFFHIMKSDFYSLFDDDLFLDPLLF